MPLAKLKTTWRICENNFGYLFFFQGQQRLVAASLVNNSILGSCSVSSPKAVIRINDCFIEPTHFRREIGQKSVWSCFWVPFLNAERKQGCHAPKLTTEVVQEENVKEENVKYNSFACAREY